MLSTVPATGELRSCSSPGLANYPGQPVLGFDNTSVPEYSKDLLLAFSEQPTSLALTLQH